MQIRYKFGLSDNPLRTFGRNAKHAEKLEELLHLRDSALIIDICKHYIKNFIPTPIENEDEYWMCSCFPGSHSTPVQISIYWHGVFTISRPEGYLHDDEKWVVDVFTNRQFYTPKIINDLQNAIPGLWFDKNRRHEKGLDTQLAAVLPIHSYFDFVSFAPVFESIRRYNFELSTRGKKVHRGHNYELARLLLHN